MKCEHLFGTRNFSFYAGYLKTLSVSKIYSVGNGIIDECEAAGLMRICLANLVRKTAPVPICPPQISHDLSWDRKPDRRDEKPATYSPSDGTSLSFSVCESHDMETDFRLSACFKSYTVQGSTSIKL
jgi:hypothetical protein